MNEPEYRSSRWTFFYKYIFVPLWAGGFLIAVPIMWATGEQPSPDWTPTVIVMVTFALLWMIPMMRRLKTVKAFDDRLMVKGFREEIEVDYEDIEWIYEIAFINPKMISLKFKNRPRIPFEKALIIPAVLFTLNPVRLFNRIRKGTEMTRYIRSQIEEADPTYSREKEPYSWLPAILLFLSAIPMLYLIALIRG